MSIRCALPSLPKSLLTRLLTSLLIFLSALAHADTRKPNPAGLELASVNALVMDLNTHEILYNRNPDVVVPIASVSKLMTAMVMLDDTSSPMDEWISVDISSNPYMKGVYSRLRLKSELQRENMLLLTLMSSENRAATSLAHHYSKGYPAFIQAMNAKARALGMTHTRFVEPTGISEQNVSTARDLAKMVQAASRYAKIRQLSTTAKKDMRFRKPGYVYAFYNTNPLVRTSSWDIELSKTGFIDEAGRCLVMKAEVKNRPVAIVLLDSFGKRSHVGDASRVKRWLETGKSGSVHPSAKAYVARKQKAQLAHAHPS